MPKPVSYITSAGDTFATIARRTTGNDIAADDIRASNPGATEPFAAGVVIEIPSVFETGKKSLRSNGLDLRVDGVNIDTISRFTFTSAIDGFRKLEFSTANEIPTRSILPVLQALAVDVGYNGFPLMTGYLDTPKTNTTRESKGLSVPVLSLPEVLTAPPPASAFPLEFKNADLSVIAQKICKLYSLRSIFDIEPGARFSKASAKQNSSSLDFLSRLAKQRAMVIGDDSFGSVVFTDGTATGAPVLVIDDEKRPDVNVKANYNASNYYSHITGVLKGKSGRVRKRLTVSNPHYNGLIKQHEFEIADSSEGELETAVNSVAARMFAEVFNVSVTVPGWLDKNGNILDTGALISVRSPREYIEDYTELSIRSLTLNGETDSKSATLNCVLPGVFAGIIPERVPWKKAQ